MDVAIPRGAAAADAGLRIRARARHRAVAHAPGNLRSTCKPYKIYQRQIPLMIMTA